MVNDSSALNVRFAGLGEIRELLEKHISPCPCDKTIRSWFDAAGIPKFKPNMRAKRGGGRAFYQMNGVEKWLKSRFKGMLR